MIYVDRLTNYLPNDEGSLPITGDNNTNDSQTQESVGNVIKPGFVIYDENGIWNMESSVELFRISYENDKKEITVSGENGDQVIAPGTTCSYVFKLKNTGNVALDYDLHLNAYITPKDTRIPVETKLSRYDGKWITGEVDKWSEISTVDYINDSFTLGSGRFAYYTLDWQWPFEGDDELDTLLGNESITQEITFTLELATKATISNNPDSVGGILATPNTGDNNQVLLYSIIGGLALIFMLILIIHKKDEDDENEK